MTDPTGTYIVWQDGRTTPFQSPEGPVDVAVKYLATLGYDDREGLLNAYPMTWPEPFLLVFFFARRSGYDRISFEVWPAASFPAYMGTVGTQDTTVGTQA